MSRCQDHTRTASGASGRCTRKARTTVYGPDGAPFEACRQHAAIRLRQGYTAEPEPPGTIDVWLTGSGTMRHAITARTAEAFRTVCGQWIPDPPPHGEIMREVDPGVAVASWHCWGREDLTR